jgi:WD40 repeat protein
MMSRYFTVAVYLIFFTALLCPSFLNAAETTPTKSSTNAVEKTAVMAKPVNAAGHNKEISVFALSPDGRFALTADQEENNFLWDVKTGTLIRKILQPDPVRNGIVTARFSPDASTLLWARYRKFMPVVWDIKSGKRLGVLSSKDTGHLAEVVSMAFSGDGRHVATGDLQGYVVLWNLSDRTPIRKFKAHSGRVNALAFIPGRTEFVSAGDDGAMKLWMVARPLVTNLKETGPAITAVAVSADGAVVYAASADYKVRAWNVALRTLRSTLTFNNRQINSIAVSTDGDFIALAEESESVLVWNVHESKVAWQQKLDNSALKTIFSPDGRSLFTSGGDNWIREWEASSGKLVRKFGGLGE